MKSASPLVYLGAGAAITTGALFLMSQAVPPTSGQSSGSWGPPKKNVVNIFEDFTLPGGGTAPNLPANGDHVVYTVPSDRWLTVTECAASANSISMVWAERYNGTVTNKGKWFTAVGSFSGPLNALPFSPSSEVGWVFRPGSQVIFRNLSTNNNVLNGYSLIGYLTRE